MVTITISPAAWHATGSLKAEGHAYHGKEGEDLVCAALTALMDGLAANLREIPGLSFRREAKPGFVYMRWSRDHGDCVKDANRVAWHFYRALDTMGRAYPDAVRVKWVNQEYYKGRRKRNEAERRDHGSDKPAAK
jgi:uncharacterized protein YsxB (DUF464 family)